MLAKLKKYISGHLLISDQNLYLLAVSGGVDSIVMAHLFAKAGFKSAIAHANFQLRGPESDRDAQFVENFASKLKMPFYSGKFETLNYARANHLSVQVAARELRYQWFEELRDKQGYHYIATAHHQDDQVETLFINLLRGCGLAGLQGIPATRGNIIRPLLSSTRDEIMAYARKNKLDFCEDSSNQEDYYLRNRIRHHLIPLLKELQPSLQTVLEGNIRRFSATDALIREFIETFRNRNCKEIGKNMLINAEELMSGKNANIILFYLLSPYGFNETQTENISKALAGKPGKRFYSPTHSVLIDRKELVISLLIKKTDFETFIPVDFPVSIQLNELKTINFSRSESIPSSLITNRETIYLDEDKLNSPMIIRNWKHGDIFFPYGINGKKKVSDLLIDHKVSRLEKENIRVLCCGDDIIWIVGYAADRRFAVTKKTKKLIRAEMINSPSGT